MLYSRTRSFRCLSRYAIRLTQSDSAESKGEIFVPAPSSLEDEVGLDLHMVPGILNLQNCRSYTLNIFPDNFPELVPDSGKWHGGLEVTFDYAMSEGDVPNVVDLSEEVKIVAANDRAEIVWSDEAFSCSQVEMTVSSLRFLGERKHHSHLEQVKETN